MISYAGDSLFLASMVWILATVWEVLALCLAVWITVKHIRELRQRSTRGIIGDCFKVLIQSHVSYFARWARNVNVALLFCWCMHILVFWLSHASRSVDHSRRYADLSLTSTCDHNLSFLQIRYPEEKQTYASPVQFFNVLIFVLGPRLILSIREYNAELVAGSDTATTMTSIAFQERSYVSTSSV